jgi:hypothetical protein
MLQRANIARVCPVPGALKLSVEGPRGISVAAALKLFLCFESRFRSVLKPVRCVGQW